MLLGLYIKIKTMKIIDKNWLNPRKTATNYYFNDETEFKEASDSTLFEWNGFQKGITVANNHYKQIVEEKKINNFKNLKNY